MSKYWFLLIACIFLPACSQQIKSYRKIIAVDKETNSWARVEGRWEFISENKENNSLPATNAVLIDCDKSSGVCRETIAALYRENKAKLPYSVLGVIPQDYRIVEWSESLIQAEAKPRAADIEIRISLVNNSAERSARETGERGAKGANPDNVEHWVLK